MNTTDPIADEESMRRDVVELERAEALKLLASVDHGRVVFTLDALPAIRPVNHIVDDGRVIMRTRLGAKASRVVRSAFDSGVVVAYEADDLDPVRRVGWSVVVIGLATTITDPGRVARYERLLRPWVNMSVDSVIAISPQIVTGVRIVADSTAE